MFGKNVQHKSAQVLLFVDVINHFEFPDGEKVLQQALPIAPKLQALKKRARRAKIPVVYVNDNFGQWRSDAGMLVKYCLRNQAPGRTFVEKIAPDEQDYFVLKPMHSAFYQTPLDVLLRYFEASTLILCGISTCSCVLCTANDAKMRDLNVIVPADCCASRTVQEHKRALNQLEDSASSRVVASKSIRLKRV